MSLEEITNKRRLLVVDDQEWVLNPLAKCFSLQGWTVETANNAEEAMEKYKQQKARNQPYSVIITDNDMPNTDAGIELIKWVREQQKDNNTPLYLHSGALDDEKKAAVQVYPLTWTLQKPILPSKIYAEVINALQKNQL